jgi:formylglycine-generating enzyme required for sulfatase activity
MKAMRITVGQSAITIAFIVVALPSTPLPIHPEVRNKKLENQPGPNPTQIKENPKDRLSYVWIPPGAFQMGCSPRDKECGRDEKPMHQVTITKGFWMGRTEVTVGAYKRFILASGRQMPRAPSFNSNWANDNMPIVNITWNQAHDYCSWAEGRLPTEAEWEYAARAGNTEARFGPLDVVAWYHGNSGNRTHEVARRHANAFGLFDVLGNVWEWVADWYDENYYQKSPSQDPPGPASGSQRVYRGGSWFSNPGFVRVSVRNSEFPVVLDPTFGFRCVWAVTGP